MQALSALTHVTTAQQNTIKHARYASLVRDASISSWAEATNRNVDGALGDEEFIARLDEARPEEQAENGRPAVSRLTEWAGKTVAEFMGDMNKIIEENEGATEQPQ
ncbi:hypothetical protein RhiJN_09842 [Ceratobasidium sp. AG-Ba]|nr:hypothetical protein RhiJN_09842 [Ceratobasidium sp. AG-Ba]